MKLFRILVLVLLAMSANAANVRFAFTNSVGQADTNWFQVIPIGDVIQADGSFITKGPPVRLTPTANGKITNSFELGNYNVTNKFLARGFLIRVPNDHGPTVYDATSPTNLGGLAISGYNTFVTIIYGSNPPPTYDEITNSLGFLPEPAGVALTNADTRDITFGGTFALTDGALAVQNAGASFYGDVAIFGTGRFRGNGLLLTNVPRTGVTGLEAALDYLTNNIGGGGSGIDITNGTGYGTTIYNLTANGLTAGSSLLQSVSSIDGDSPLTLVGGAGGVTLESGLTSVAVTSSNVAIAGAIYGNGAELTNIVTTIFVATNGNDSTASRGGAAFRTIYAASLVAHQGDTISVGPGNYNATNVINIPDDGFLIGSYGKQFTFVTNWNFSSSTIPGVLFHPGTNSTTRGFTFVDGKRGNSGNINYAATWGAFEGSGQKSFQNAKLVDCIIYGSSDGIYVQHSKPCSMTLEGVRINSDWDSIMIKGEPSAQDFAPHSVLMVGCIIDGNHGGGWTNKETYGVAMHATGSRLTMVDCSVRMTNTTFAGTACAVSVGTGASSADVRAKIINSDLWATTLTRTVLAASIDDCYAELIGASIPPPGDSFTDGVTSVHNQSQSAGTLYGIQLPAATRNWGGIPFLKWTGGSSNVWSVTATNAGSGSVLHRPGAAASSGGLPTASLGEPYWGKVDLGADVTGTLPTANIFWAGLSPDTIPVITSGGTDVTDSPLSASGGVVSGNGSGITGDDEAYGPGWDSDTTFPTKNAVYDKIQTISGGGSGTQWNTNGNSSLPIGSFLGTLDNFALELRSSNAPMAVFNGYSNTVVLGRNNQITGWQPHSTIGGGRGNLINGRTNSAFHYKLGQNFIGGGASNTITDGGTGLSSVSILGGGVFNHLLNGDGSAMVLVGGDHNTNQGGVAFVGGGQFNSALSQNVYSNASAVFIGGGMANIASGDYATLPGGRSNTLTGIYGTIPGGLLNLVRGSNAFAAGFKAQALHKGSVVFSDVSSDSTFASGADNEFAIRAAGGLRVSGGPITGNGAGITNIGGIKVYRALLTQSGTDAPVATVLENSLGGTVVFSYSATGQYIATLAGAFTADKTIVTSSGISGLGTGISCERNNSDVVYVFAWDGGTYGDDILNGRQSLEILVYP